MHFSKYFVEISHKKRILSALLAILLMALTVSAQERKGLSLVRLKMRLRARLQARLSNCSLWEEKSPRMIKGSFE